MFILIDFFMLERTTYFKTYPIPICRKTGYMGKEMVWK